MGKREEKVSLQTKDPLEARLRHGKIAAQVAERWADLEQAHTQQEALGRFAPTALSEREAHELARDFYTQYIAEFRDNPSQGFWNPEVGCRLWTPVSYESIHGSPDLILADARKEEAERWCIMQAKMMADHHGIQLEHTSLRVLSRALGSAVQSASLKLKAMLNGEYDSALGLLDEHPKKNVISPVGLSGAISFQNLFDGWQAEKVPSAKTIYAWKRVIDQLGTHLGHTDADLLTPEDVIGWKNALVDAGLAGKTIRDGKLAPLRAILQWGVDNRLLKGNAAERVTISIKAQAKGRKRGYTDEEARTVLSAALSETEPLKRWVPWICAYTGARLAEVCQLRAEDLRQRDGVRFLTLAAEAGSLKNINSERALPVHSALIEVGLPAFVTKVKSGPLFADTKPDRFGSRGGNGTKALSRWIRDQGLDDQRLQPNHAWRHRFKTLGRRHGLASDIVDAITGHGRKTVADTYGEFELAAMKREIEKIPRLQL